MKIEDEEIYSKTSIENNLENLYKKFDEDFLRMYSSLSDEIYPEIKILANLKKIYMESATMLSEKLTKKDGLSDQFATLLNQTLLSSYLHSTSQSILQSGNSYTFNIGNSISYQIQGLKSDVEKINKLSKLSTLDGKKNVVIVGSNGAGKSSFAEYFREAFPQQIVALPAQKILFFEMNDNLVSTTYQEVQKIQVGSNLKESSLRDYSNYVRDQRNIHHEFSKIIAAFVTKSYNDAIGVSVDGSNIYYKFLKIFELLYPNISFDEYLKVKEKDVTNRELKPKKDSKIYDVNQMSDGEKVSIYYILQILLAPQFATIIVDEPETFLNASIYNRLWNLLETERRDCRFIYVSHRLDFIESRKEVDLVWFKNYSPPDEWDFQFLETKIIEKFPKELLIQLTGVKKDVLFCEGEDKSSFDYKIYQALFPEISVIPVGNSDKVKQYTKTYNDEKSVFLNRAFGIIDFDLRTENEINDLQSKNIFTTSYLEIEMLMCDEKVLREVLGKNFTPDEANLKVTKFKTGFINKMSERKPEVIKRWVKKQYENILQKSMFDTSLSLDDNLSNLTRILTNLSQKDEFAILFNDAITNNDYQTLLSLCTLEHKEIIGELGNQLDTRFSEKAKNQIVNNIYLKDHLKEKYFMKLQESLSND